jgi:hypothetical protein
MIIASKYTELKQHFGWIVSLLSGEFRLGEYNQ